MFLFDAFDFNPFAIFFFFGYLSFACLSFACLFLPLLISAIPVAACAASMPDYRAEVVDQVCRFYALPSADDAADPIPDRGVMFVMDVMRVMDGMRGMRAPVEVAAVSDPAAAVARHGHEMHLASPTTTLCDSCAPCTIVAQCVSTTTRWPGATPVNCLS